MSIIGAKYAFSIVAITASRSAGAKPARHSVTGARANLHTTRTNVTDLDTPTTC